MPKVHVVKKARKDHPGCGVKAGESYYWWGIMVGRRGQRRCSKTRPRPSQLTQSEFWQEAHGITEEIDDYVVTSADDLREAIEAWCQQIQDLADACREKFDNMPQPLQDSDTGQLLEERRDACEDWVNELEAITIPDDYSGDDEALAAEHELELEAAMDEVRNIGGPQCG